MPISHRLTPAQKRFLASYIKEFPADILPRSVTGMTPLDIDRARGIFFAHAANADFDGAASGAKIRMAEKLEKAGFLAKAHVYKGRVWHSAAYLQVVFSPAGIAALFDLATNSPNSSHQGARGADQRGNTSSRQPVRE